jgi:hypothetical protein
MVPYVSGVSSDAAGFDRYSPATCDRITAHSPSGVKYFFNHVQRRSLSVTVDRTLVIVLQSNFLSAFWLFAYCTLLWCGSGSVLALTYTRRR